MPEIYASHPDYGFARDFKGYGEKGLEGLKWPNKAKIAILFVINYEEASLALLRNKPHLLIHTGRRALRPQRRRRRRDKPP